MNVLYDNDNYKTSNYIHIICGNDFLWNFPQKDGKQGVDFDEIEETDCLFDA